MASSEAKQGYIKSGFLPIVGEQPTTLILGSLPSEVSILQQQYYAHTRNAFWPIMMEISEGDVDWPYELRRLHLQEAGFAVWDVLAEAKREGSLDSSIEGASMQVNDFDAFFHRYPSIELVLFNGAKAAQVFKRRVTLPDDMAQRMRFVAVPSTSPAHASMRQAEKQRRWTQAINGAS